MESNKITQTKIKNLDQSVLRAVYALNMCTVSVSQIIDYNDVYILEQEYDAILNNLNLEKIPKADALKNILTKLLNTITFFKIQEIRKTEIEKQYQQRMKNAIWSAIPNLNVIVAGGPAAIAYSLASQIGIGYMNYRKEKNNVLDEKEKKELELRITAIEQFNALRRELFTTAWELAEEYNFEDRLRLTEKQIKQYNTILMDQDELRKYVRLEAIQNKFEAFPPFWYFFGHTACYISENKDLELEDWERNEYRRRAKLHFEKYDELNKFNILREDQMTAAFALEYSDLLLLEENPDKSKISKLIDSAVDMSGNALDIKELCAISYLKIGNTNGAAELLKHLVNEEYNTITNAKLLSRIYVSQYLNNTSPTAKFDYKTLQLRVGENNLNYLFPMPESIQDDLKLQLQYLVEQKINLQIDYRLAINELSRKFTTKFNAVIPVSKDCSSDDNYYSNSEEAIRNRISDVENMLNNLSRRKEFIDELSKIGFRFQYIDILNSAIDAFDDFELWRSSEKNDICKAQVKAIIASKRLRMKNIQDNMSSNEFTIEDYMSLQRDMSFKEFMGNFVSELKENIMNSIDCMTRIEKVEKADYNLSEFCKKHNILLEQSICLDEKRTKEVKSYLDYNILGSDGIDENKRKERIQTMNNLVKIAASELIQKNRSDVDTLLPEDDDFKLYFKNSKLKAGSLKEKTLIVIDDKTKTDRDLVLTSDGILIIDKNRIKPLHGYNDENVEYIRSEKQSKVLLIGRLDEYTDEYSNEAINIGRLYRLIQDLNKEQ